jgi:hypothetical protein
MIRGSKLAWIVVGICLMGATPSTGPTPSSGKPGNTGGQQATSGGQWRDYNRKLTPNERQKIVYIVTTVSDTPDYKLMFKAGSLTEAGNEVKPVHPLRFLEAIFTNPGAHAAIINLWQQNNRQNGSYARDRVFGGIIGSLKEEMARGNLTDADIKDFARTVHVNPTPLITAAHAGQWEQFINYLVENVPRKGDHNVYDM